eukprot:594422-Prorocentrum_minimum.AAC.2
MRNIRVVIPVVRAELGASHPVGVSGKRALEAPAGEPPHLHLITLERIQFSHQFFTDVTLSSVEPNYCEAGQRLGSTNEERPVRNGTVITRGYNDRLCLFYTRLSCSER